MHGVLSTVAASLEPSRALTTRCAETKLEKTGSILQVPEVALTVPFQDGETFPAQGTTERISIPMLVDEYVKSGDDL